MRNAMLAMSWRDVAMFSWRCDPAALEPLLPKGTEIDLFDGGAWLTVVPFRIGAIRLRGLPIPLIRGYVSEINLRTYVRVGEARGIYFFSLDAASLQLVGGARIGTNLPYFNARVTMHETDRFDLETTRCDRRGGDGTFRASYAPNGDAFVPALGSLDAFLVDRYRFYVERFGMLTMGEIAHEAWSIRRLTYEIAENSLGAIVGMSLGSEPQVTAFARRLRVRAAPIARVADVVRA